jgi:hypothetical protein
MADPANPPAPGAPPCPECGFTNAVNSLYCQDCGAKLPVAPPSYLTAGPAPAPDAPGAAPASSKPVRKKKPRILSANRGRPPVGEFLAVTFRVVLYAAFLAGVIQFFRAPRDFPPPVAALDPAVIEQVRAKFSDSLHRGIAVDAPWMRTNAYLAGALVPANNSENATFVRAVALHRPDGFAFVTQKRLAGLLSIYTTVDYAVVARGSGLSLTPTGGALGRLPLPAWTAPALAMIGGDPSPALTFELDILKNARNVRFTPAGARIEFSPAQP